MLETESGALDDTLRREIRAEVEAALKADRKPVRDTLVAVIPLIIALVSIYFTSQATNEQLSQSRGIESAKIISELIDDITEGGDQARLAQIAFVSVPLNDEQRADIGAFIESKSLGDAPLLLAGGSNSDNDVFAGMLDRLFHVDRETRSIAYSEVRSHVATQGDADALIRQMGSKVESEPLNIKGRSNVLSILADTPAERLAPSRVYILEQLQRIERLSNDPAYAVGPQTRGWISNIRDRLSK